MIKRKKRLILFEILFPKALAKNKKKPFRSVTIPRTENRVISHELSFEKCFIFIHFSHKIYENIYDRNTYDEESKICAGGKEGEAGCYVSEKYFRDKSAICLSN